MTLRSARVFRNGGLRRPDVGCDEEGSTKAMNSSVQVVTQAAHALKKSSHPALRNLSVEGTDQSLIISGRVTSYYLKQLAQETIMQCREGLQLVNKVDVVLR